MGQNSHNPDRRSLGGGACCDPTSVVTNTCLPVSGMMICWSPTCQKGEQDIELGEMIRKPDVMNMSVCGSVLFTMMSPLAFPKYSPQYREEKAKLMQEKSILGAEITSEPRGFSSTKRSTCNRHTHTVHRKWCKHSWQTTTVQKLFSPSQNYRANVCRIWKFLTSAPPSGRSRNDTTALTAALYLCIVSLFMYIFIFIILSCYDRLCLHCFDQSGP